MANDTATLHGLKILIVEDAFLVAIDICAQLEGCGCRVAGPVGRVGPALDLVRKEDLDGALLDVNLEGEFSFPVAAALEAREVPYIFLTGYDAAGVFPPEYQDHPRLSKPFHPAELATALVKEVGKRATSRVIG